MASYIRKYITAISFTGFLVLLSFSVAVTQVSAATTIRFSGTIGFIEVDNGSSTYSGLNVGDTFSGSITYGDSSADASSIDVISSNSVDYIFTGAPYGGSLTTGSILTPVVNSSVGIWDNKSMDDDAVSINNLYGAGATTAGTIADAWFAESAGSARFFAVSLYSLDTSTFPGTTFQAAPPMLAASDFAVFMVGEADGFDNDIFLATGIITSISVNSGPTCDIDLNQSTFVDGETVTLDVFRLANLTNAPVALELKSWLGLPAGSAISVINQGADGSLVTPAGWDIDLGPISLFTVTSSLPRGSYEFSCRMLDPVTGELLAEDLNSFSIQSTSNTFAIGDTGPAGGTVIHVSDGGLHGLEAAPQDLSISEWGCAGTEITGADGTAIGTGAQNTADILAECVEPGSAAVLVNAYTLNGFSDWFLPSKDELNELFLSRAVLSGFDAIFYWSSSEDSSGLAWGQRVVTDGFQNNVGKNTLFGVRPIRAF